MLSVQVEGLVRQHMCLHRHRALGQRRMTAHVHHCRVIRTLRRLQPAVVHAEGRQGLVLGQRHIRRGETHRAAELLAVFDLAGQSVARAQQAIGGRNIALGKHPSDAGGRHRFAVHDDLRHHHGPEAMLPAVLAQGLAGALAALAEGVVEAADHHHRRVGLHHFGHEILGGLIRPRPVEGGDAQVVHAEGLHDAGLLRDGVEEQRRPFRREDAQRVGLEGQYVQREIHLLGQLAPAHQQRLMAAVHAVEHAQNQHAGGQSLRVTQNLHRFPPYCALGGSWHFHTSISPWRSAMPQNSLFR